MKICYFGDYDPTYIRNDVMITGLRDAGADLITYNARGPLRLWKLTYALFLKNVRSADILCIGSGDTSRPIVFLARLLWWKPLVWDMHYSLYDARVFDRELAQPGSIKSWYYYILEWIACRCVDIVLLDTNEHAQYVKSLFCLTEDRCRHVLVGANEEKLRSFLRKYPAREPEAGKCVVSFHGKYIPLQGVQYIVEAAKILESDPRFSFVLVGKGQTFVETHALAEKLECKNITFIPRVPYEEIPGVIVSANISLGIFGDTNKAKRVIANKLYEAVALGVPVVTADTPGVCEVFTHGKDIMLCRAADADDLAAKLRILADDPALRARIGGGGYATFRAKATPLLIGKALLDELQTIA